MISLLETLPDIFQSIAETIMPNPIGQGIILVIIFAVLMVSTKIGMPTALMVGLVLMHTINIMFPSDVFSAIALNVITFAFLGIALVILWMRKK